MNSTISNDRLMQILQATPEQEIKATLARELNIASCEVKSSFCAFSNEKRILESNRTRIQPAPASNPSDVMLNKRELAERLRLTVRTVENWQRRGVLPFVKVGKVVLFHWPDVLQQLRTNFRVCRRIVYN